jgi:cytochrome b6-f complex iron-sulfur subunit
MNRRAFLSWGTVGVGALCSAVAVSMAAVGRFLVPSVFYEPPQSFKIGSPADFPFGPPTFMADEKIFVFRDRDKGFAVASAVCTHLGCTVAHFPATRNSIAPATAAYLVPMATVLHGPAPRPLNWFEVTLARDGQLNIDKDKIVPSSYRLMV